jgi:hypothetical protein
MYEKNSVGREESILCTSQVPQRRLATANGGGNFVSISWQQKKAITFESYPKNIL